MATTTTTKSTSDQCQIPPLGSIVALVMLLLLIPKFSFSWGVTGHRAIGLIAEQNLKPKAKKKLQSLLAGDKLPLATTWMDDIRSAQAYNHTADWHWVTIETGTTYQESTKNKNGDVIETLHRLMREIKSGQLTTEREAEHVKMILHLVGDIHQPLHVGCCDDQGGNKVRLKWFGEDTNLHRIWDSDMIDGTKLSFTELAYSLKEIAEPEKIKIQSASVEDWAKESMALRSKVYDTGDGKLGYTYAYKNMPLVKERLLLAGLRLAGVLNELYG
ncbi:MAG: S1/P1 nuclease [Bacteroidetes bacterium]|nr:S1/P1 nuclease [Bacteroidota bacterium]